MFSSLSLKSATCKLFIWDTGTTGKDPRYDHIRALAVVEYSSSSDFVTRFSTAVGPRDVAAVQYYDSRAPPFATAWKEFVYFVVERSEGANPLLVSHNASFDVSFLKAELDREGTRVSSNWSFGCSLQLARVLNIDSRSYSQADLADHFGVVPDRVHHAETDVITLRRILIAMSDEYCILPLLYRDAQQLEFFDRVPESDGDGKPQARFFVTLTGRRYHSEGCRWLSRSCIPKRTPPPGLKPCSTCRPPLVSRKSRPSTPSFTKASDTDSKVAHPSSTIEGDKRFVPKSEDKYHVDACKQLRGSKTLKDCRPAAYDPRSACPQNDAQTEDLRSLPVSTGGQSGVRPSARFYTTKTGRKFHIITCRHLRKSKIAADPPPAEYEPCAVCLPYGVDAKSLGAGKGECVEKVSRVATFKKREINT
ncbi:Ribonuclease H [Gracilaria domingensis]|nr:Ribonuclease H [Gracilaria domingensis]